MNAAIKNWIANDYENFGIQIGIIGYDLFEAPEESVPDVNTNLVLLNLEEVTSSIAESDDPAPVDPKIFTVKNFSDMIIGILRGIGSSRHKASYKSCIDGSEDAGK